VGYPFVLSLSKHGRRFQRADGHTVRLPFAVLQAALSAQPAPDDPVVFLNGVFLVRLLVTSLSP